MFHPSIFHWHDLLLLSRGGWRMISCEQPLNMVVNLPCLHLTFMIYIIPCVQHLWEPNCSVTLIVLNTFFEVFPINRHSNLLLAKHCFKDLQFKFCGMSDKFGVCLQMTLYQLWQSCDSIMSCRFLLQWIPVHPVIIWRYQQAGGIRRYV